MYILCEGRAINMAMVKELKMYENKEGSSILAYWSEGEPSLLISNLPMALVRDCFGAITDALASDKKTFNVEQYVKRKIKIMKFYEEEERNNV